MSDMDVQGNPFDFEDPERFEEPFPLVHDIEYVNGIRVSRIGNLWICPHDNWLGATPELVARSCAEECEAHPTDSGYPVNDPKHPEYHSLHADWYDLRERG